ncbi:transposase [Phormidium sp. FACHB-1136]|uniref:transposase n=1 Tax=Phormidium sp. FACHB-1136 TaxID=2692848 RepID=UPI001689E9B3|nr:transposase [Phormidium sp. FACHB-1136]MBD2428006.1 transposase [Phormidium sp. FACHB-1136]
MVLEEYIRIAKETPDRLQIWFWDEAGFSLRVRRGKTWTKKGKRKKASGERRKGRFSVMGGVRLSDKKRIVDFISKGTGDSFFSVLHGFYEEVKQEWVGEGRRIEDFEQDGPKILGHLD